MDSTACSSGLRLHVLLCLFTVLFSREDVVTGEVSTTTTASRTFNRADFLEYDLDSAASSSADDVGSCDSDELQNCTCVRRNEQMTVKCLNTGFYDPTVFRAIPDNCEQVVFRGNDFYELPKEAMFGDKGKSIRVLDLVSNNIQIIRGHTFNKLTNLESLVLSDNDVFISDVEKSVHPRMFSSLHKLETLQLRDTFTEMVESSHTMAKLVKIFENSQLTNRLKSLNLELNELTELSSDLFCYLPQLTDLSVADNDIAEPLRLKPSCMQNMRHLHLHNNSLHHLDQDTLDTLDSLPKLENLTLSLNPFACDCHLLPFQKWLKETQVVPPLEKRKIMCFSSEVYHNRGKAVLDVPEGHLLCMAKEQKMQSAYVALTIILICVSVLLLVVAYMNRRVLISCCYTGVVRPLTPSSKYIHIENDSEGGEYHV